MSAVTEISLPYALIETMPTGTAYRVALIASHDDAQRIARSMQRAAKLSGIRYHVEVVQP